MSDLLARVLQDFAARVSGPLHLRFVLQPAVAIAFAVMDGLKDARTGRPPYGWTLFTHPEHRGELMREGWKSIGKVFLAAVVIDLVFQLLELHAVHAGEALIVGVLLAILPYGLLRGVVTRIASRRGMSRASHG